MKTKFSYKAKWILLIIVFFINSCKSDLLFTVSTIVFPDGSCKRTLKAEYEKEPDFEEYPIPVDSTWEIKIMVDSAGEKPDSFLLYSKMFPSVKELNKLYADTNNKFSLIDREVKLEKKFRWFFTIYDYSEKYGTLLKGDPLSNYVKEKDMWIIRDEENDSLQNAMGLDSVQLKEYGDSIGSQYFLWITNTNLNNIYDKMVEEVTAHDELKIYKDRLIAVRDSAHDKLLDKDIESVISITDSIVGANGEIMNLINDSTGAMGDLNNKLEFFNDIWLGYHLNYELSIPGLLTSTNADSVKSDIMCFGVSGDRFYTADYVMTAVSHVKNIWAYYVSGAIVILAIIALVAGLIRKRIRKV